MTHTTAVFPFKTAPPKLASVTEFTREDAISDSDPEREEALLHPETVANRPESTETVTSGPEWAYSLPHRAMRSDSASGLLFAAKGLTLVAQPEVIQQVLFPILETLQRKIIAFRGRTETLLSTPVAGHCGPLLVVAGPSYIRDPSQAKGCAKWIGSLMGNPSGTHDMLPLQIRHLYEHQTPSSSLLLALRTNLSQYNHDYKKPGLIRGAQSIMTYEIDQGIPICRALLSELAEICPIVGEVSDTITPQYFADLFCLGLVSSTLTESQLHRELVSGTSYAMGFHTLDSVLPFDKSMYKHKVIAALDGLYASGQPHQFLLVTKIGTVAVVGTVGNRDTFVVLPVNLELDFSELEAVIDSVYSYKNEQYHTPKIMLDVSRISSIDYAAKELLVTELLSLPSTRYKILGVLVDSGDLYVPQGYDVDLMEKPVGFSTSRGTETRPENDLHNRQKLIELNKYFVKSRMYHTNKAVSRAEADIEAYYESFMNADRFVKHLEELSQRRMADYVMCSR